MAKILGAIPPQAFELIRDRIGLILKDELDNQNLTPSITVTVNRSTPYDITELPAINVCLAGGTYGNKTQINVAGQYRFNIDAYSKAKTTSTLPGDQASVLKVERMLGMCRFILESSVYNKLDFPSPFISHTHVADIEVPDPLTQAVGLNQDLENIRMGRLSFAVNALENSFVGAANPIEGFETKYKIVDGVVENGSTWVSTYIQEEIAGFFDFTFDNTFQ